MRCFWKWTLTLVAGSWFGGTIVLLPLGIVPAMWMAYGALPGILACSITPALWMGDVPDERPKIFKKRKAAL